MTDITTIPTEELVSDLKDSIADIKTCEFALSRGVDEYNGKSVQYRLDANKHFVKVITAELERRKWCMYCNPPDNGRAETAS